jgi:single-strand DNA-binding protein
MSDGMNKVILLGNLGSDAELRHTGSGTPVLQFRLATSESYKDKNNAAQERTEWHNVVLWGTRAEALSKILAKGSHVLVEGVLRTSSYEKDGQKRYKTEVHARELLFVSSRRGGVVGSDMKPAPEPEARGGRPARAPMRVEEFGELPY